MRHTIAAALRIFRTGVETLLSSLNAQFQVKHSCRPDLGIFVQHWSLFIGWPHEVACSVDGTLTSWFASRPYRRACDIARPIP